MSVILCFRNLTQNGGFAKLRIRVKYKIRNLHKQTAMKQCPLITSHRIRVLLGQRGFDDR